MINPKPCVFYDSWIMFKRCMLISTRNLETMIMSVVTPFFIMLLFSVVFGGITDVGDINYIDFIISGIILQSVAQGSQFAAINVSTDMTKGVMDRFRSMPISKAAVLIGHAAASVLRNTVTAAVVLGTAFLIGFRSYGGPVDWLIAIGIFMLYIIAISWVSIFFGLISRSPESTTGYLFPFFILPFLSSGFAPTYSLPRAVRWFAQHQPMSPIIDSTRALMLGWPTGNSIWLAIAWCVGISAVSFVAAVQLYKRKLTQ